MIDHVDRLMPARQQTGQMPGTGGCPRGSTPPRAPAPKRTRVRAEPFKGLPRLGHE